MEDASLTLLQAVTEHLGKPKACVQILFMDFSSAFNTVNADTLLSRLFALRAELPVICWIKEFLCNRPVRVEVNEFLPHSLEYRVPPGMHLVASFISCVHE